MQSEEITSLRLSNLQISNSIFNSYQSMIEHLGAIQAQDFDMSKIASNIRISNCNNDLFFKAYNSGEILRTHVLRPTWHLVSKNDISWMLQISAPQIKTAMKPNDKKFGLTNEIYTKCNNLITNQLGTNNYSREEIIQNLQKNGIETNTISASQILMNAEIEQLIISGEIINGQRTYALFDDRAPKSMIDNDEALSLLAKKYFQSHGPATAADFKWWSGLNSKQVKQGIESQFNTLKSFNKDGIQYFYFENEIGINKNLYLLPAFDEYIIGYTNRELILSQTDKYKVMTSNGLFRPMIVLNGKIIGIWQKNINKNTNTINIQLFNNQNINNKELIINEFENKIYPSTRNEYHFQ